MPRRRFLYGALGTAILGASGVGAAVLIADDGSVSSPGDPNAAGTGASTAPTTSTTAPKTTATIPVVDDPTLDLPQPDGPPSDAYAAVPINQIGTIAIPRIGLDHAVYEGIWLTVLDEGPGHWPGSAMPGQTGNTVFPGHRVTHSHPFRRLDELAPGDEITFTTANGTHTYRVRETLIVSPKDLWVVEPNATPEVTLVACHPPHSARQRIVVKGDLDRSTPNPAAADAAQQIADAAASIPL
jgi:sortase A